MPASGASSPVPSGAKAPAKTDSYKGPIWPGVFGGAPQDDRSKLIIIEKRKPRGLKACDPKRGLTSGSVENYPDGYPRLAAFMNSDVNFAIYRKFGKLQARHLLELQAKLTELEDKLDELDRTEEKDPKLEPLLHNRERAENPKRDELMREISDIKREYHEMLLLEHQIRKMPRPTPANQKSVFDYIWQEKPLDDEEFNHIYHIEDMVAPGYDNSEDGWVKSFVQAVFQRLPSRRLQVRFFFFKKALRAKPLASLGDS